ncbi:STAS domain-containing protein [Leptothermofonsia sp. ETS-13]|uniref:STAS domain-containing protein n=1 Tax=Leptothermofonsia sp. ETS-13 TaxID=3035696 RepID=UPI003B9FB14D
MHTTVDSTATCAKTATDVAAVNSITSHQETRPNTVVLQPGGSLDCTSSLEFQRMLQESLELALEGVIVDLLWVGSTDTHGIAALAAGIHHAAMLGKMLSFHSMDVRTRAALEAEWIRQREVSVGPWNEIYGEELKGFLDSLIQNQS